MDIVKSSTEEMSSHPEILEIVKTLMPINSSFEDWFEYIDDTASVWKVFSGDQVWGFYTLSSQGFFGEGHAYVLPSYRSKSVKVLKHMIDQVNSMGLIPKTTASSDFPHVVKLLKMLGFTEIGVEKDGIEKASGFVDVHYYIHLAK